MSSNPASVLVLSALILAGCAPYREPVPITPPGDLKGAAVVRRAVPEPAPPAAESITGVVPSLQAPSVVPPGSQYVCVTESGGVRQETAIQFAPKVGKLCEKHPEMGPCQYEREMCRRSGGHVYAAGGLEITPQTEAEYDKKVLRVRFKAN